MMTPDPNRLRRLAARSIGGTALALVSVVAVAIAQEDAAGAPGDSRLAEIEAGDRAYRLRRDPAQAEAALRHYRAAFARTPDDAQVAWRVGMAAYFMGIRHSPTLALKQKSWAEGRDAARRGTEIDPSCAPCHFWTAINMALYGESVGVLKMLFTLKTVRRHLRRSIDLDPGYLYCSALRVQGAIDGRLPGILGGSKQRAGRLFEQAIKGCPDEPLNYLVYAELLERGLHDRAGAIQIARRGLAVPPLADERIESIDCLPRLRRLLDRLEATPGSEPTTSPRSSSGAGG